MRDKPGLEVVVPLIPEARDLREIGEGGFKVVYRAMVGTTEEAVKLVRIPRDDADPGVADENFQRLEREIRILRRCQTPFLVKLGGIAPRMVTIGSDAYVVYSEELLPGQSLRQSITTGRRPTLNNLVELGVSMFSAVKELSALDFVHRDIKPENIMVTGLTQRPYVLLDLGIAFHVGGTPVTRDRQGVLGTLYYLAPEMLDVDFRQNLDFRADLYTVGLTLYEWASGINPFRNPGDPQYTTLYRIKTLTPPALSTHRGDLPSEFCDLADQLLKKMPALRPSNIDVLIRHMEAMR